MWTKPPQTDLPGLPSAPESRSPDAPLGATAPIHPSSPTARNLVRLGSTLEIKGEISGDEDLQIDGKVKGPISLPGHRLTIGRTAQLSSEVTAREVIVYGTVAGNIRARDRIEIKKDAEVLGDITTARISVEDGASFKGRIEIERAKAPSQPDPEAAGIPVEAVAN
jgi:cytoskeletal protein CcmA (bactofilin family)